MNNFKGKFFYLSSNEDDGKLIILDYDFQTKKGYTLSQKGLIERENTYNRINDVKVFQALVNTFAYVEVKIGN